MKILLTGADGFTGVHFMQAAKKAGHEVTGCAVDLADRTGLANAARQCQPDAVVHLAGIAFVSHADSRAFYDVNMFGTLNLLDALVELDTAPRVLLASSANVYGNAPQSPINEAQSPAPVNHYAMSKLAMELMARNYADRLPLFFARPFNYTGPGQAPSFVVPKLIQHFVQRKPFVELGNLNVEREFNDVRFLCAAYLGLLARAQPAQTYNICTGTTYTLNALLQLLHEITGHVLEVRVNPDFVRAHEIQRLCGDPGKLLHTVGDIPAPPLRSTLSWMLDSLQATASATP
ncbi:GDP-mannose 4,6-dehydratase [Variovorax terrae]|uniref:GDP-mannose 4,6-dehydratase n=1 Tax=Variovorax terrae TaxID=2923278 RepID=A0A9X1VR85_9BURK|nr:GDP-mannose 4,6-dehydratase [Variovorax terrae]MCJ0761862.1 GDP-mannose 4,6-dehydratase [Variovorax terrae]